MEWNTLGPWNPDEAAQQRNAMQARIAELEAENARLRAELAALTPPQPVADWREGCSVLKRTVFGWDIKHMNWIYSQDRRQWLYTEYDPAYGRYTTETDARAALAACVVPPPGVQA